jgi:dipeptidyl aminopeptidase/acylaminoacyl peptidase
MSEYRTRFTRASERFRAPDLTFEALLLRRDHKRRNQRIAAGVAGFAVAIVAIVAAAALARSTSSSPMRQAPVRNGSITFFLHDAVAGISPDGGQDSFLFPCCNEPSAGWVQGADWSPEGTRFAFGISSRKHEGVPVGVHVLDVSTGETQRLTPIPLQSLEWSPDGSMIAYSGPSSLGFVGADGSDRTTMPMPGAVADPSWSADGTQIAFVLYERGAGESVHGALHVMDLDRGTDHVIATASHGILKAPAWSPDGSTIAYFDGCQVRTASPGGSSRSLLAHVGDCRALGRDPGDGAFSDASQLVWSPDGSEIAFNLQIVGRAFPLFVMDANGTGLRALRVPSGATPPIGWQPVP